MGGSKPWPEVPVGNKEYSSTAVLIMGAGISGMCTAIDLIRRNKCHNFVIIERSSSIGGTWHDNKYPGCCCDIWSTLYSFSFEQNPDWTREYPGQEEILQYLLKVAAKYNLYRYIRFNTSVDSAEWDDVAKQWKTKVKVAQGTKDSEFFNEYTITSDFLVSAVGQLNVPKYPEIPGLDDFKGKIMHSARWDWNYDIRGKRIAMIGNGATAVQIAPEIAQEASHLTIFQRTPNWVVPRADKPVSDTTRLLKRVFPPFMWRTRANAMDFRESTFEALAVPGSGMSNLFRDLCLEAMRREFPGQEDMWQKLTPKYAIGCKRIIISDDFYPTLAKDNVTLETRKISNITANGIRLKSEEEELPFDLIVLATGFQTLQFMHPIKITGRNGKSLKTIWAEGAKAYKGVTLPEIPNFGMLYGPNTNLGHNSIILMIEAQSKYICALVKAVLDARGRDIGENYIDSKPSNPQSRIALVPKNSVVEAYNKTVQSELSKSSFADPNCNSWYKDENGLITNNYSRTVVAYQKDLEKVDWSDYDDGDIVVEMQGRDEFKIGRVIEETFISDRMLTSLSIAAVGLGVISWFGRGHGGLSSLIK